MASWNANRGQAAKKLPELLTAYDPDLVAVQEISEPPPNFHGSWIWKGAVGGQKNQGVLLWAKPPFHLKAIEGFSCPTELYEAAQVWREGEHILDAVCIWVKPARKIWPGAADYDKSLNASLEHLGSLLHPATYVMLGDFNNVPTEHDLRWMKSWKLLSAYHHFFQESPGSESRPTIRHKTFKSELHIDWCVVPSTWKGKLLKVEIGAFDDWVPRLSDHAPMFVEVDWAAVRKTARAVKVAAQQDSAFDWARATRLATKFNWVNAMKRSVKTEGRYRKEVGLPPLRPGANKCW